MRWFFSSSAAAIAVAVAPGASAAGPAAALLLKEPLLLLLLLGGRERAFAAVSELSRAAASAVSGVSVASVEVEGVVSLRLLWFVSSHNTRAANHAFTRAAACVEVKPCSKLKPPTGAVRPLRSKHVLLFAVVVLFAEDDDDDDDNDEADKPCCNAGNGRLASLRRCSCCSRSLKGNGGVNAGRTDKSRSRCSTP